MLIDKTEQPMSSEIFQSNLFLFFLLESWWLDLFTDKHRDSYQRGRGIVILIPGNQRLPSFTWNPVFQKEYF